MRRLLIVDDNPMNIKVLTETLAHKNYDILTANTGERGLMVAERGQPQLILLDINLPGINGFEACEKLKENPKTSHIPVIFLSALDDTESKVRGFEVGGIDYVTKPFQREEVLARVETQLRIAELNATLEMKNFELQEYIEELKAIQNQLSYTNQLMLDSISYAQRIQRSVLPPQGKLQQYFPESFIFFRPKDIVSGDFYQIFAKDEKVMVISGDCTGHGVPGALMTMLGLSALDKLIEERSIESPNQILDLLNTEVQRILKQGEEGYNAQDGMDVVVACFNKNTNELHFASALRPVLIIKNGEEVLISGDRASIGGFHYKHQPFTLQTIQLEPGDTVYLFSDGYPDQFGGEKSKKYQFKRFKQLIQSLSVQKMSKQFELISEEFDTWRGSNEQTDDVLVIGIKID